MATPLRASAATTTAVVPEPRPALIPCLMLKRGEVYLPGPDGPVPARAPGGGLYDPFDVIDRLVAGYPLVYLVDLDGVERAEPQLDFLQELARDATLWVDGGVRTADQAIDILITGAQRAVLSSAVLRGPRQLRRAWRLSTQLIFEVEVGPDGLDVLPEWETSDPLALVRSVREVGVDHAVVSPRGIEPDWNLVRTISAGGPTWVDGAFEPGELPQLQASGALGGIFHIGAWLEAERTPPDSPSVRDDDT